jgi:hypothetical protein
LPQVAEPSASGGRSFSADISDDWRAVMTEFPPLNALLLVTGRLMAHGPTADDANLRFNFLGLHELRKRTITLFDEAEDLTADSPLPPVP